MTHDIVHFLATFEHTNPFRYGGGGLLGPPFRKISISPEPNLRWISDQSVNSSLSVAVQEKKNRVLYLSRLKHGGPMKFENTFFQIAKLRRDEFKSCNIWILALDIKNPLEW